MNSALGEPAFWRWYLCEPLIVFAEEPETPFADGDPCLRVVCDRALKTDTDEAETWWNRFTNWYEGVFDEADGCVDKPSEIVLQLGTNICARIECHPGDLFLFLKHADHDEIQIGNIGPHCSLPALRFEEVEALSFGRCGGNLDAFHANIFLLLLPWASNSPDDDSERCETLTRKALIASLSIEPDSASAIAACSVSVAEFERRCNWQKTSQGWSNDCSESSRYRANGKQVKDVSEILEAASPSEPCK